MTKKTADKLTSNADVLTPWDFSVQASRKEERAAKRRRDQQFKFGAAADSSVAHISSWDRHRQFVGAAKREKQARQTWKQSRREAALKVERAQKKKKWETIQTAVIRLVLCTLCQS